jgi:hypothetical protein
MAQDGNDHYMNLQKQWLCPECHKTSFRSYGTCEYARCGGDITTRLKKATCADCNRTMCHQYVLLAWLDFIYFLFFWIREEIELTSFVFWFLNFVTFAVNDLLICRHIKTYKSRRNPDIQVCIHSINIFTVPVSFHSHVAGVYVLLGFTQSLTWHFF